jgi:hypothetical protein
MQTYQTITSTNYYVGRVLINYLTSSNLFTSLSFIISLSSTISRIIVTILLIPIVTLLHLADDRLDY